MMKQTPRSKFRIALLKSGAAYLTLFCHLEHDHVVSLEVTLSLPAQANILMCVGYTQLVERAGSIIQMNEQLDVCP